MTELYSNLSAEEIEHLYADDNPALKQYIATKEKEDEEAGIMNESQVEEYVSERLIEAESDWEYELDDKMSEHLGEFLYNLAPFFGGELPKGVTHFTHYWDGDITPTINHLGGVLFDVSVHTKEHQELLDAILAWNAVCVSGSEIMYYEKDELADYSSLAVSTCYIGGKIPVSMLGHWDNEDGEPVLNKKLTVVGDY